MNASLRESPSDDRARIFDKSGKFIVGCWLALAVSIPLEGAGASGFKVLHTFAGGSDGSSPEGTLIKDSAGNLYGTTFLGGEYGYGTVFKLAPDGTHTVLHSLGARRDGANPYAGVIEDATNNLYGTTAVGGTDNQGAVFKLAPDGTETVLYSFTGGNDGGDPDASLIQDAAGNLYGTAQAGPNGAGVVFKIAPDGSEAVLYAFTGGNDGGTPTGSLIKIKHKLYGTTAFGGASGAGTVFRLSEGGTEKVLYSFKGGNDGAYPFDRLIRDAAGNFYGTTYEGGPNNAGTVFKLAPDGTETVLYAFTGGKDGGYPFAGLVKDGVGNLYGTTNQGGTNDNGTVFKVAADGTETVLHTFTGGSDGANPFAGLFANKKGHLFGVTQYGGDGYGTVFELKE